MEKYVFREANGDYASYFLKEKELLLSKFGDSVHIEHVGSTSVPGLGGKGIVDIIIGVEGELSSYSQIFLDLGYLYREHVSSSDRLFFRKEYGKGEAVRRVHIHLVQFGGSEWRSIIAFRDHLIKNPDTIEAYVALKKKAVEVAKGEGEVYRGFKKEFIEKVVEKELNEK